jgi:hypothetical protein
MGTEVKGLESRWQGENGVQTAEQRPRSSSRSFASPSPANTPRTHLEWQTRSAPSAAQSLSPVNPSNSLNTAEEAREKLVDFYSRRDPTKLCRVDAMMEEFKGQESKVVEMVDLAQNHDLTQVARNKLIEFYKRRYPEKLVRVDAMMKEFKGHEKKILDMIKYADIIKEDREEREHEYMQHEQLAQHQRHLHHQGTQYLEQYQRYLRPNQVGGPSLLWCVCVLKLIVLCVCACVFLLVERKHKGV